MIKMRFLRDKSGSRGLFQPPELPGRNRGRGVEKATLHNRAYLFLAVATLCWGGNAVAGKLAVGHASPMMLNFWRWLVAFALITSVSLPQLKKDWPVIRRHLPILAFLGAVGYAAFNGALYTAASHTSAINIAVLQVMIPMLIFVFNFALFRVKVTGAQILGFGLTLLAGVITAAQGDAQRLLALSVNIGDALMIVAVTCYAAYTVALRWRPVIDWRSLMAVCAFFAVVANLLFLAWEGASGTLLWPDRDGWLAVGFTAIFASLVAQVLFVMGVDDIGANRAGLFINLVPVFGTLLSIALLGEKLQAFHLVALALALGGIAIAERRRPAG